MEESELLIEALYENFHLHFRRYPSTTHGKSPRLALDRSYEPIFNALVGEFYTKFRKNYRGYRTSRSLKNKAIVERLSIGL